MPHRWIVVGVLVATSVGCAALAGLVDPADVEPALEAGADGVEDSSGGGDAGADVAIITDIGYGTGRDGPLVIGDQRRPNDYAPLAKSAAVGDAKLTVGKRDPTVSTIPVQAGDVLLVVQSAAPGVRPEAGASPLESDTGTWELVYVTAVNGDTVDISVPLAHAFTAPGAQIVRVVQATTIEVADGGEINGQRWDGTSGGIIAILATESITLNGRLEATNLGFRGAKAVQIIGSPTGCTTLDGLVDAGFAPRGEGIGAGDAGFGGLTGGRGNAANGGGGGDCHNSGGAGGGNGGRGGAGGDSQDNARPVGGMGGAALALPAGVARLRFGGGGGAGENNDGTSGTGGSGGGVIFVRAPKVIGNGMISARGGGGSGGPDDGAGGGGAGGTVYLDLAEAPVCQKLSVTGAGGGNAATIDHGPGGGGGGGLVFLKGGMPAMCAIELQAGASGVDGNSVPRNAGPPSGERSSRPYVGILSDALAP